MENVKATSMRNEKGVVKIYAKVKPFGNSAHVILPMKYLDKKVLIIIEA